jgi:hypothetical protein
VSFWLNEFITIRGMDIRMPQWLEIGESMFIPSLNHKETMQAVRKWAPRWWNMVWEERGECGALGVRIWRVK